MQSRFSKPTIKTCKYCSEIIRYDANVGAWMSEETGLIHKDRRANTHIETTAADVKLILEQLDKLRIVCWENSQKLDYLNERIA
jgi:hypothetical protein